MLFFERFFHLLYTEKPYLCTRIQKGLFSYGESIRFGMIWFTIISLGLVVLG